MKISLCHLPPWNVEAPPINIGYLSSVLKNEGYEVESFDFNARISESQRDIFERLEGKAKFEKEEIKYDFKDEIRQKLEEWSSKILKGSPQIVGFTVYEESLGLCLLMADKLKNSHVSPTILFGGPAFPYYPEFDERDIRSKSGDMKSIDYIVLGEGEKTTVDLIHRIEENKEIESCAGIVYKDDDKLKRTGKRGAIKSLDELPFPDYSDLDFDNYNDNKVAILGSRGCPNRCNFCQDTQTWDMYRSRSAEDIYQEMKLRYRQGFRNFRFYDLHFNASIKQLKKWIDLVEEDKFFDDIGIWGQFCCHKNLDQEVFERLERIGLESIVFGVESGSNKILDSINKQVTTETIEKNLRDVNSTGIKTGINILIGFPGETDQTINQTIKFLKENEDNIDEITSLNSLNLLRGSYIYQNPEDFGLEKKDKQYEWYTKNGNNLEKRYEWMVQVYKEIEKMDIECEFDRLKETFDMLSKYYKKIGREGVAQRLSEDLIKLVGEKHET